MSYKKFDKNDLSFLRKLIGENERILTDDVINEEYSHDELSGTVSFPDAVVKVASA